MFYNDIMHREARSDLLHLHLGSTGVCVSDGDLDLLAGYTEGFTGSDIAHVASDALLQPIRELDSAQHWLPVNGKLKPCSHATPGAVLTNLTDLCPHQVHTIVIF